MMEWKIADKRDKKIEQLTRQLRAAHKVKNYFKTQSCDRLACIEYAQEQNKKLVQVITNIQSFMKLVVS